ncbi:hypothetical protein QBC34DRAFT_421594 [Podospora aff. communis PSN243]|uniref:Uncharacterized protein n=1 Tax=Podospora aff. communis PSN243 TaxID=3040156 RepID=A0AAV9GZ45_9PEZI|nr:hypothetical protein QBC34DRAFT_421594 [Podospora aff. communis PSN243]
MPILMVDQLIKNITVCLFQLLVSMAYSDWHDTARKRTLVLTTMPTQTFHMTVGGPGGFSWSWSSSGGGGGSGGAGGWGGGGGRGGGGHYGPSRSAKRRKARKAAKRREQAAAEAATAGGGGVKEEKIEEEEEEKVVVKKEEEEEEKPALAVVIKKEKEQAGMGAASAANQESPPLATSRTKAFGEQGAANTGRLAMLAKQAAARRRRRAWVTAERFLRVGWKEVSADARCGSSTSSKTLSRCDEALGASFRILEDAWRALVISNEALNVSVEGLSGSWNASTTRKETRVHVIRPCQQHLEGHINNKKGVMRSRATLADSPMAVTCN